MKRIIVFTVIIGVLMMAPSCDDSQSASGTASAESKTGKVIELTKKKLTMEPGATRTIRLKGAKASKVKWSTSNKKTATVSKGKIKARKKGTATITAKYKNRKYKCKVTVKKRQASEKRLSLMLEDTKVNVDWNDNESVAALKELVKERPLTIQMSMYGGFEQVGSIGSSLPRNDKQTTTAAGDIVLYSGNQIVVFYGSNSWSYTRLGHITDKTASELKSILGKGDIRLTISLDDAK